MTYAPINNSLDFMDEIPRWLNHITGEKKPINESVGPIGTYKGEGVL